MERLVCTQKLRGARKEWMNTVYSGFHGKVTSTTTTSCVVWGCVYEWLAEAYRLPQGSECLRTTGGKGIENLYFVLLMDQSMMRNHRKTETRCPTWVGENIRMLWLEQLSSLTHSCHCHMSLRFMHSMSFLSFCSIGLTLVELPSSHCLSPCLQASPLSRLCIHDPRPLPC